MKLFELTTRTWKFENEFDPLERTGVFEETNQYLYANDFFDVIDDVMDNRGDLAIEIVAVREIVNGVRELPCNTFPNKENDQ